MNKNPNAEQKGVRVFESDFLESLTHVHPAAPIIVWGPVTLYFLYDGSTKLPSAAEMILFIFMGVLTWTFIEYIFHRYLFHFPAKSKLSKRLVFLFHGLHHDEPHCKTRLVFPPFPAFMILSAFYLFFSLIIPPSALHSFLSGFLIGYLCYDYIHYATHHFPMNSKMGRYLRKYHLQHHFSCSDAKYGVSSPLWDYVFNTVESKRKNVRRTANV